MEEEEETNSRVDDTTDRVDDDKASRPTRARHVPKGMKILLWIKFLFSKLVVIIAKKLFKFIYFPLNSVLHVTPYKRAPYVISMLCKQIKKQISPTINQRDSICSFVLRNLTEN